MLACGHCGSLIFICVSWHLVLLICRWAEEVEDGCWMNMHAHSIVQMRNEVELSRWGVPCHDLDSATVHLVSSLADEYEQTLLKIAWPCTHQQFEGCLQVRRDKCSHTIHKMGQYSRALASRLFERRGQGPVRTHRGRDRVRYMRSQRASHLCGASHECLCPQFVYAP